MTNKEIVEKFYAEVFNGWDLTNLETYMKPDYRQHNPNVEDGRDGFRRFAETFLSMKPRAEIVRIAQDGDMVFVFFKCTMGDGTINKVCDIYRLEEGQLAEHWDVVEHDLGHVQPVHGNGLF